MCWTFSLALCFTLLFSFNYAFLLRHNTSILAAGAVGADKTCSLEMYGGDEAAYWTCAAQFALQSNWFPSPISGLYIKSYQAWNGLHGFWQNGVILETMVNFVAYTNNTSIRYFSVVTGGERSLDDLLKAYGPYPSFDDMGWYGLAFARIYEVTGIYKFLQDARDIFDWSWRTGWGGSDACVGGFWFDDRFRSKQTITNVQMLHLAARLYRFTDTTEYKDKMDLIYNYITYNRLIDETTQLISDGAKVNCTPDGNYGPTYNAGVMIGALAEMFKIYNDMKYVDLAYNMTLAIIEPDSSGDDGILVEPCEPNCDGDGILFKGIFVRNVRYLIDVLEDTMKKMFLKGWIQTQIQSNVLNNICDVEPITNCNLFFKEGQPYFNISGPVFSPHWRGPYTYGAPIQQTAVLDLFIAGIAPDTTCTGQFCDYDPYYPIPQPLTCSDNPCPSGQDCCEFKSYNTSTCCAIGQTCNTKTGICA